MSARRFAAGSRTGRRTFIGSVVAALAATGFLVAAPPASAAGTWFVAPGGVNNASCGTSAAPCATVTYAVISRPSANGDTINVAPGTYTDHPVVTKGVTIVGSGAGATFSGGNTTYAMGVASGAQTVTLTNLTLTNGNYSAGGGLTLATGKAVTNNVTITGNKSTNGGGVYVPAATTFTMNGGSIDHNTSATSGGGVYAAGLVTTSGGSISNNSSLNGGAITNGSTMTIDGTTISNNTASGGTTANGGNGGAFYNAASLTVKNATLSGNKAVASTAGTIIGWGGAIFSANLSANAPTVTLSNTTISGGSATYGGAIATYPTTVGGTTSRVDATGLTLSNNSAQVAGGAVTSGGATFTGSSITGNHATNASLGVGGGIYALATTTLDGTEVTGNDAGVTGGGLAVGNAANVTVKNSSSISNNDSVVGGGVVNTGMLTVTGSHVDGNSASYQGGGLYNGSSSATDAPKATLAGTSLDDNDAALGGGGIVTLVRATLSVTNGEVNGNSALGGAGVTVGDGAPATFDGTDFEDNTATNLGGGAFLSAGTLSLTRVRIHNNHATHTTGNTGTGAGIYSGSTTASAVTKLTVSRSEISGNDGYAGSAVTTASTGSGATNTASIDNSTIVDNTNTSTIGALELFHPLTLTNSTVTGNTATGANAGALAMIAPTTVGVAGTILSGNGAKSCSGAVNDGGYNITDPADASCGFGAGNHDQLKAPQLGVLADNGGQTQTRLPAPSSPALDVVTAPTATGLTDAVSGGAVQLCGSGSTDQRDTARPQGAKCDVGAVEAAQVAPTVDGPSPVTYSVGVAGAAATYTTTGSPQAALSAAGMPAGVVFHDNGDGTGTLSGTPGAHTGGSYTVVVTATNEAGSGSKSVTLEVNEAPELTGPSSDTYTVNQAGGPDEFHAVHGHPDPTLSTSSTLPGGVTFTPEDGGKGHLAGTPQVGSGGVYPITIKGMNGTGPDATFPFTLTVDEGPTLAGPDNETFTVGTAGSSAQYTTTGTPTPTLAAADLPPGLGFTTADGKGRITGTPESHSGGEYDVTVTATNGIGTDATKTTHVTVDEAPALSGPTSARFVVGIANTIAFSSTGYPQAHVSVTGDLPVGLSVDSHDGTATISGTASASDIGDHRVTVTASNGVDPASVIHLTVSVVPHVSIVTTSLQAGAYKTAYDANVMAGGGQPPYSFEITSGSLPTGLSMDSTGHVTGTPTGSPATSTFTVKVTDSDHPAETATKSITLTVGKGETHLAVDPVLLDANAGGGNLDVNITVGTVHATLTGGFPLLPIAGQPLVFKAGTATVCGGTTTATGEVKCQLGLIGILAVALNLKVTATYAGSPTWLPSSGTGNLIG